MHRPPETQTIHERFNTDLPFFAKHAPLIIKDKSGKHIPWTLNLAQRYTHDLLEAQLRTTGRVRALILKGRQQGMSTYTCGRNTLKVRKPGTSILLISHEAKSTDNLFRMIRRFHDHMNPAAQLQEGASNRHQLAYPSLDSAYTVGTAGNENVGRSGTAQIIQGSEVAYWENDYEIQEGAFESVGDVPGSEIILESTSNGPKGLFYEKCMQALKGKSDYILIFIPWFWQEEYERQPDANFTPTEAEEEIVKSYFQTPFPYQSQPISRAQALRKLAWRRVKLVELATGTHPESGLAKFRQVYPCNVAEAFLFSGVSLFRPDMVMAARKSTLTDDDAPLILGVDPAGDSDDADRTTIAFRRGRHLLEVQKFDRMRPMELAGIIGRIITTQYPDAVFIDRGYGEGTIDRLREMGFGRVVHGIAFNERPLNPAVYLNKRSEIIVETAKWVNAGGVRIPDSDEISTDFAAVPLDETTSTGLKYIKSKREIKKALKRSTDIVDAVALTFSYPVRRAQRAVNAHSAEADKTWRVKRQSETAGPLKSLRLLKRRG